MKKVSIIGRGTVGCMAVTHFLRWTDWDIDWIYDPSIEPSAVGEGTNLIFPRSLSRNINFSSRDMDAIDAMPKLGIWKRGWGLGQEFYHTFPSGSTGIHFNAVQFQKYIFESLMKNRRLKAVESNTTDYENLDSDFVMVCTGSPKEVDINYKTHESIPVNSCVVFQCPWDLPRFFYSLTFAKKYGWVFGIPLRNRCSIGYLYNSSLTDEQTVRDDTQSLLREFDLEPAQSRKLNFRNYSRISNYSEKVSYNGNASFFLEPLEATSTGLADLVTRWAFDVWHGVYNSEMANMRYHREINQIESMICLHYLAGSAYESKFWDHAKEKAEVVIRNALVNDSEFFETIHNVFHYASGFYPTDEAEIGSWRLRSYIENIDGMNLRKKLKSLMLNR